MSFLNSVPWPGKGHSDAMNMNCRQGYFHAHREDTMRGYGQFCPLAQAAEVITERWTPPLLRELVSGSHRSNDIQRGVPLITPALLTKRLKTLELCGIIERRSLAGGGHEYHLTQAGEELRPWVELMGVWGQRWVP